MSALDGFGVLVTGGGTGIGTGCAMALAADGAAVTICGRTESKLTDAAARISAETGTEVHTVVADVTDEESIKAALAAAAEVTGQLKGVVANAGGGGGLAPLHMSDAENFRHVLELNVIGTFLTIKHAVPHLIAAGGGSLVGMSSIAAHVTHPYFAAYPPGKAGIEALCRNAADEFGAAGVRVNAIRPGFIDTEIMQMIPRDTPVFESYLTNTPMGDVGQPSDVGQLARFLIGPESRWITGNCINVDGGHHLRRGPDYAMFTGMSAEILAGGLPDQE